MTKPTVKAINIIRKKYGLSKEDPITSVQYREACLISKKETPKNFSFLYELIEINENTVHFRIHGNHLSKNRIDALPLRKRISYRSAFKHASNLFFIQHKSKIKKYPPMEKAIISFLFVSRRSRDYDNNSESIKPVQDTMTRMGIIVDDSRKHLEQGDVQERICKPKENPFIEVIINRIK